MLNQFENRWCPELLSQSLSWIGFLFLNFLSFLFLNFQIAISELLKRCLLYWHLTRVTFVKSDFTRHWNNVILSCLVVKYDIFPVSTLKMYIALQDSIIEQKDLQDVTSQPSLISFMCNCTTNDWSSLRVTEGW